jgi:hypothetical protein
MTAQSVIRLAKEKGAKLYKELNYTEVRVRVKIRLNIRVRFSIRVGVHL